MNRKCFHSVGYTESAPKITNFILVILLNFLNWGPRWSHYVKFLSEEKKAYGEIKSSEFLEVPDTSFGLIPWGKKKVTMPCQLLEFLFLTWSVWTIH